MKKKSANNNFFNGLFLNDKFILVLISINSIAIFAEGFKDLGGNISYFIGLIDSLITFTFAVEAIIKIRHYGWTVYIKSGWNKLDFLLVSVSLPSIFFIILHFNFHGLSFLLIFRTLRVFKFLRFFKFIPGVEQIINGLTRALKSSVFVLFALFIFNFMVSVLSCYIFKDASPEYFGNPIKSMYSIFRISTSDGWSEIPDKISQNSEILDTFLIKVYFIVVLITAGVFGLSFINSIFVDSMVMDNNDALEKKVDELNAKIDILLKNQLKENQSNFE